MNTTQNKVSSNKVYVRVCVVTWLQLTTTNEILLTHQMSSM